MIVAVDTESSWQQQRSRLNHDWLKNQVLPALTALIRVVDGEVETGDPEGEIEELELGDWTKQRAEIQALLDTFEARMSPRSLFELPPLSRCDEETKTWLPDLVHELWRARYPVQEWVEAAVNGLEDAEAAQQVLVAALATFERPLGMEELRQLGPHIRRFRSACQRLAACIEQFPSRVLVG